MLLMETEVSVKKKKHVLVQEQEGQRCLAKHVIFAIVLLSRPA